MAFKARILLVFLEVCNCLPFILCWVCFFSLAFSWSSYSSGTSPSPWKVVVLPGSVFWVLSFLLFMLLMCLTASRAVIEARVPGTYFPCLGLSTEPMVPCAAAQPRCRVFSAHVPACGWHSFPFLALEERTATAFVFILLSAAFISPGLRGATLQEESI